MAGPSHQAPDALSGLASGILGGGLLITLGIGWAHLSWAVMGAVVGAALAPKTGRVYGMALFVAASLLSAKAGAIASLLWFAGSDQIGGGIAAFAGIVFHPVVSAVVKLLPDIIEKRLQ